MRRTGRPATVDAPAGAVDAPVLAVVGRPNVGKSTLVNRILGSRQAVVEDTPGVTRDRVTYDATWRGRAFTLVDTGGWEPAIEGSPVLAARVAAQARVAVDAADAVLFVTDAVVGVTDADAAVAAVLRRSRKPVVLAANKVDDAPAEAGRALVVVAGPRRAVPGERAARPGQRRPARRDSRRACRRRRRAARGRVRSAPGGADRPAERREVEPAQQAGRVRAGAGRLGRRHDQGSGGRADRPRRDHLAVRRHGRDQAAGQPRSGRRLLRRAADRAGAGARRGRGRAGRRAASRWPSRTCGSSRW